MMTNDERAHHEARIFQFLAEAGCKFEGRQYNDKFRAKVILRGRRCNPTKRENFAQVLRGSGYHDLATVMLQACEYGSMRTAVQSKPKCKLIGTDGNVFSVIGTVTTCLRKHGLAAEANEFRTKALQQHSYHDVLALVHDYVVVR